jgi:hypothetical protein
VVYEVEVSSSVSDIDSVIDIGRLTSQSARDEDGDEGE